MARPISSRPIQAAQYSQSPFVSKISKQLSRASSQPVYLDLSPSLLSGRVHNRGLIRPAVAVDEDPLRSWRECPPDVIVGIDDGVPGVAVAHFQIDNVAAAAV